MDADRRPVPPPGAEVAPRGGAVVVDIGDDVGALVVYLGADWQGAELHVRLVGAPGGTTHTGVWERTVAGEAVLTAVLPSLMAGSYEVLDRLGQPVRQVEVAGGRISEVDLRT